MEPLHLLQVKPQVKTYTVTVIPLVQILLNKQSTEKFDKLFARYLAHFPFRIHYECTRRRLNRVYPAWRTGTTFETKLQGRNVCADLK